MPTEFRNEPFTDFSKEENAQAMRAAIQKVQEQLGREYPLVIGGERITTDSKLDSFNPANRTQLVGRFNKATKELANQAVEKAAEAFRTWKNVSPAERAALLLRVAGKLRRPGPKPTATLPKRSTSANSTAARCCATQATSPSSIFRVSKASFTTYRWASARSFHRGIFHLRSWPA